MIEHVCATTPDCYLCTLSATQEREAALTKELQEQARLLGMSGSREAALLAKLEEATKREAKLQAEIERQKVWLKKWDETAGMEIEGLKLDNAKLRGVVAQQASRIERLREALRFTITECCVPLQYDYREGFCGTCRKSQDALAESADALGGKNGF